MSLENITRYCLLFTVSMIPITSYASSKEDILIKKEIYISAIISVISYNLFFSLVDFIEQNPDDDNEDD